jgi:hypothetical protein
MTANASSFPKKIDSPNSTGVLGLLPFPRNQLGFSLSFLSKDSSSFPLQENAKNTIAIKLFFHDLKYFNSKLINLKKVLSNDNCQFYLFKSIAVF